MSTFKVQREEFEGWMSYTDTPFESFLGALKEVIQCIKGQSGCEVMDSLVDFRIVELAPDGKVKEVFGLDSISDPNILENM